MSLLRKAGIVVIAWSLIVGIALVVSGCATLEQSRDDAKLFKQELPAAEKLFVEAKGRFNARRDAFTTDELIVIDRGIAQIERGTAAIRENYQRGGVSEAVAFVRFVSAWSDVKAGYLLSVGVIGSKDLSPDDRALLNDTREKVAVLERSISSIEMGQDVKFKYQAAIDAVGAVAGFIRAVKSDE